MICKANLNKSELINIFEVQIKKSLALNSTKIKKELTLELSTFINNGINLIFSKEITLNRKFQIIQKYLLFSTYYYY